MAVKYSGLLKFTDEIKAGINLAADGTVEKAVVIDGDGVETPIGGGSSDFSTAEVTITNNTKTSIIVSLPIAKDDLNESYLNVEEVIESNQSPSIMVALYKGKALCQLIIETPFDLVYTEGVEVYDADHNMYFITGDGTITVTAKSE